MISFDKSTDHLIFAYFALYLYIHIFLLFPRKEIHYLVLAACFGYEDGSNKLPRKVLDALTALSLGNWDYLVKIVNGKDILNRSIQDANPKWLTLQRLRFLHPVITEIKNRKINSKKLNHIYLLFKNYVTFLYNVFFCDYTLTILNIINWLILISLFINL